MDLQKEREAFDEWHYEQYLLENPNIDISNAKYIYDYAHKNVLVFQLKESHFTAWQAAIARMEVRINTLDEMLLNQGEALAQAKAQAVMEWISVEDELPTPNKTFSDAVIAWDGLCIRRIPLCLFNSTSEVTHWMPIPQPPKAQEPTND